MLLTRDQLETNFKLQWLIRNQFQILGIKFKSHRTKNRIKFKISRTKSLFYLLFHLSLLMDTNTEANYSTNLVGRASLLWSLIWNSCSWKILKASGFKFEFNLVNLYVNFEDALNGQIQFSECQSEFSKTCTTFVPLISLGQFLNVIFEFLQKQTWWVKDKRFKHWKE